MVTVDNIGWWLVTAKETESCYLDLKFVCHTVNQSQVEYSPSPNRVPVPVIFFPQGVLTIVLA